MIENPHFAMPFKLAGGRHAAVLEQDSTDEVFNSATAVAGTVRGTRLDVPGFGIPDLPLTNVPLAQIQEALDKYEPRASYRLSEQPDLIERMVRRIQVEIQGGADA